MVVFVDREVGGVWLGSNPSHTSISQSL